MELNVVFKDMEPVPAAIERLEHKLQKLEVRLAKPISAKVVLVQHKNEIDCQIRLPYFKRREFEAVDKVERQLKRAEERLQGRRDGKSLRKTSDMEYVAPDQEVTDEGEDQDLLGDDDLDGEGFTDD